MQGEDQGRGDSGAMSDLRRLAPSDSGAALLDGGCQMLRLRPFNAKNQLAA
jgi:hypothetical protein